jgi:hypothetical protein
VVPSAKQSATNSIVHEKRTIDTGVYSMKSKTTFNSTSPPKPVSSYSRVRAHDPAKVPGSTISAGL